MPWISSPDPSDTAADPASTAEGWTCRRWASAEVFGEPVPLKVSRWRVAPGARTLDIPLGETEALAYVIAGSGTASASPPDAGGEPFALGAESVLWLPTCDSLVLEAGLESLDVLVARSTAAVAEGGFPALAQSLRRR